jgi:hypothetical protein
MYFVLAKKVKTSTGRRIVQREKTTRDAQRVLQELIYEGVTSTKAVLNGRSLFTKITTARYNHMKSMPATVYISEFEKLVEQYNDQQQDSSCRIGGMMLKNLLQNAFSGVPFLRDVANREQEMAVRGFTMLGYHDYKYLLENAAAIYDEKFAQNRSVNLHDTLYEHDIDDDDRELSINVMKGKLVGSSMNKETWNSIGKENQTVWDQLDDRAKKTILQYAYERAQKKANVAKVNQTVVHEESKDETLDVDDGEVQATEISDEEFQIMNTEINDVMKARKEAHPGDVRRMMGKKKAQVKFTKILEDELSESEIPSYEEDNLNDLVNQYWKDDEDFQRGDLFTPWISLARKHMSREWRMEAGRIASPARDRPTLEVANVGHQGWSTFRSSKVHPWSDGVR